MFFIYRLSYSQDKAEILLVYRHGCHGKCKLHDSDTCGLQKDTKFELITIRKINGQYLKNQELLNVARADSLIGLINYNWNRIDSLNKALEMSKKLFFVPPYPDCSEFEEFTFYKNKKVIRYEIFNHEHNETFELMTNCDLEMFKKIGDLIK